MFGVLKGDAEYQFGGSDKEGERISFTNSFEYEAPKEAGKLPIKVTKGDVETAKGSGSLLFNSSTGRLIRREHTYEMKGTFTIQAFGKESTIAMEQESTAVSRILDKNPLK
jgi:hypothetical protein